MRACVRAFFFSLYSISTFRLASTKSILGVDCRKIQLFKKDLNYLLSSYTPLTFFQSIISMETKNIRDTKQKVLDLL